MSYLALARKWRPRRFEDVLGQRHVVQALAHALDGDRLHPAILLTGTRGVGKTTLGRIIAKGLNCETGVTSNPCGQCSACREVDEGRFVDLLEIDAASRTKVDDTRQLLDNVQYSPVRGRYKVYLIDEVHMLSNSSFNALLKTLEEPPPHVKFILATTDPQKLPVTVLSRCLQFALKRLPVALIRDNLMAVLERESVSAEPGVCAEIARAADGSMRDGLSLLDQAIAFAGGEGLKTEAVEEMIGAVGRRTLLDLLQALAADDRAALLACIRRLDSQAPDYAALLADLATKLQRLAVLQILPGAADEDEDPVLNELAAQFVPEDVQLYYQIAVMGRRDLPWAPDPRLGFEMTIIRMLAFRPDGGGSSGTGSGAGVSTAAAGAGSRTAAGTGPRASANPAQAQVPSQHPPFGPAPESVRAVLPENTGPAAPGHLPSAMPTSRGGQAVALSLAPVSGAAVARPVMQVAPVARLQLASETAATPASNADAAEQSSAVSAERAAADRWAARIETLGLDAVTRQLARHCAWGAVEGQVAHLTLEHSVRHLLSDDRRRELERALTAAEGAIMTVEIVVAAEQAVIASAAQRERERAIERQAEAERDFASDPIVREMVRQFDATIRPGTVRPLE